MLKRIACFLIGHAYEENIQYMGKLDNGLAHYKKTIGNCLVCGKKPKSEIKTEVYTGASE